MRSFVDPFNHEVDPLGGTGRRLNLLWAQVTKIVHIRTKKLQQANLQQRRLWWEEESKWINIRVTTRALKTIQKKGLGTYAKSQGIDLNKI